MGTITTQKTKEPRPALTKANLLSVYCVYCPKNVKRKNSRNSENINSMTDLMTDFYAEKGQSRIIYPTNLPLRSEGKMTSHNKKKAITTTPLRQ